MGNGSCLCSDVKYSFTDEPLAQALCHCRTCRKVSGTTHTTLLLLPLSSITFTPTTTTNPLSTYTVTHETGLKITIHRCSNCGSGLYKETDLEEQKGLVFVFAGSLDDFGEKVGEEKDGFAGVGIGGLVVQKEFWVRDRVAWLGEVRGGGAVQCQKFE